MWEGLKSGSRLSQTIGYCNLIFSQQKLPNLGWILTLYLTILTFYDLRRKAFENIVGIGENTGMMDKSWTPCLDKNEELDLFRYPYKG